MSSKIQVELSRGEEDWTEVRECFVRAFHHYSLYKYLIPNKQTRPEFLRRYLEAIYDVTVRNGNSILLVGKLKENNKIIGGVIIVPPSQHHGGWECEKDEDFWEAYEKYYLKEVDVEAFKRMEKYEEWEYENISKHVCSTKVPLWNGIFCAVDPDYAGKGCGSMSFPECLRIINDIQKKKLNEQLEAKKIEEKVKSIVQRLSEKSNTSGYLVKLLHSLALLTRRSPPIPYPFNKVEKNNNEVKTQTSNEKSAIEKSAKSPMLFMISHSQQAVRFYQKNGFQSVTEISYPENMKKNSSFSVNVLVMDPTETGDVTYFSQKMNAAIAVNNHTSSPIEPKGLSKIREFHMQLSKIQIDISDINNKVIRQRG